MPLFASAIARRSGRAPWNHDDSPPDEPLVVGSWELLRPVHRGAYADVFLARPAGALLSCADYVVKRLRDEMADNPTALRMMANEAAAGRALQHPHVAPVLESHLRREPRHLVLPRLEGVTLALHQQESPCCVRRALRCVRQIAEGLAELHDRGWRHGDVKPSNIIVSPEGHATLIDLSMAAPTGQPLLGAAGTPQYAAPEIAQDAAGPASDVYSLGVVMFELLAGHLPFQHLSPDALADAHRSQCPPRLVSDRATLPNGASQLVRRMLEKSPHDRPFAWQVIDELTPLEIAAFVPE